jgi:hypothetical protein
MTGAETDWPSAAPACAALITVQDVAVPAACAGVAGPVLAGAVLAAGAEVAVPAAGGEDADVVVAVPPLQAVASAPMATTTPVSAIPCRLPLICGS